MKKQIGLLLAMVMLFTIAVFPASAADLKESAVNLNSGKIQKGNFVHGEYADYKITMPAKGKLTVTIESFADNTVANTFDSEDRAVKFDSYEIIAGRWGGFAWTKDTVLKKLKVTWTADNLPKGTYYFRFYASNFHGSYLNSTEAYSISAKYDTKATADSEPSIVLPLSVGKSLKLGTTFEPDANVNWSTSSKSVATVSQSGVVKGVKKGEATITAVHNKNTLKIRVKVS